MHSLAEFTEKSLTAFHARDNLAKILSENGFAELKETEEWKIEKGGKYYVSRNGSSLIAFKAGEYLSFNIVASHADSPCFKLKNNPEIKTENYVKYNVERYGGGIFYSWLDRPLKVAGRVIVEKDGKLTAKTFVSEKTVVIPSVAIHFNRTANDGIKLNPQVDMCPIAGLDGNGDIAEELAKFAGDGKVADCDLYLVSDQKPFYSGYKGELLSSPRIDNLSSALSSADALINCDAKAFPVVFVADNEEVGSSTKQGAGSKFLYDVLKRIAECYAGNIDVALANSFMLSFDNAHAVHPNHAELSDPTNKVTLGGGIVIKHHAGQNYTTDGFSSAIAKKIFDAAGAKYQDFYMRSDLPCGGTLGAISSGNVSIKCADIGLPQLAMHSAVETMAVSDYEEGLKGITAFLSARIISDGDKTTEIL